MFFRFTVIVLLLMLAPIVSMSPVAAGDCAPDPFGTAGFWVSSTNTDEILRFDADGSYLDAFTGPGLNAPRSVTVTPAGEVYVASQFSNEILVFDLVGNYLESFTAPGLAGPTGAAISPDGDYLVSSFGTDEVFHFAPDRALVDTYTSPGLNGPNCVVFRPDGEWLVTGQFSNDVHRFSATGVPLGSFPATDISSAMGALLDLEGRLLVAGGANDHVALFDCDGMHVETWDIPGGPQSLALREDGTVFISTFYSDEVLQVDASGNIVGSWSGGDTLRGLEFFPGPLPEFVRGDVTGDGDVGLGDVIGMLQYLFAGGAVECPDAADVDDDGTLGIADPLALLGYLFQDGAPPPEPFSVAGVDPTADTLGCLD